MMSALKKIILIGLYIKSDWLLFAEQPVTLFCHGIVDNHSQIDRYINLIQQPCLSFDFPDAQFPTDWSLNNFIFQSCALFGKKPVNLEKMHMGHGPDIETLHSQIDKEKSYILFGLSRGGATAISYLAQYNPSNIQALIIDAAPADVVACVEDFQYGIGYKFAQDRPTQEAFFHAIFPAYPINSIPAVQDISHIKNKNLPIFIVHSLDDARVHISSSWKIYTAFLQAGFQHVYLCQLNTGSHGYYMQGPERDFYLKTLHSFYKKYDFIHDNKQADLELLEQLQPTLEEIDKKLSTYQDNLEKQYENNLKINRIALSTLAAILLLHLSRYNLKI